MLNVPKQSQPQYPLKTYKITAMEAQSQQSKKFDSAQKKWLEDILISLQPKNYMAYSLTWSWEKDSDKLSINIYVSSNDNFQEEINNFYTNFEEKFGINIKNRPSEKGIFATKYNIRFLCSPIKEQDSLLHNYFSS